jgi:hypothetical protein
LIEIKDRADGGATAHVDGGPKLSVLVGGGVAALRRVIRETDASDHPVRLIRTDGCVQWPSTSAAAHGIAAERAPVLVPTVSQWGHR